MRNTRLPTCTTRDQPYRLLKGYELVPLSNLQSTKRVDLRKFAKLSKGVLYVEKPMFQKVWVPLNRTIMSHAAMNTARTMLCFLDRLRAERNSQDAVGSASLIIVQQFKKDLVEMGVVRNAMAFSTVESDNCVFNVMTATEYVTRVFIPEQLPSAMSTRSFLMIALDLLDNEQLKKSLSKSLSSQCCLVPRTIVHARTVDFSRTVYTLLTEGDLCVGGITVKDAERILKAASPRLLDYFSLRPAQKRLITRRRPLLTRCIRSAVAFVHTRTRTTRHLLTVACIVTVILAVKEGILKKNRISYKRIYRATNLSRYAKLQELKDIVSRAGTRGFTIQLSRVVAPRRRTHTGTESQ